MKTTSRMISLLLAASMMAPTFAFAQPTTQPAQPVQPTTTTAPAQPTPPVQQYQQQYQPVAPVAPAQPAQPATPTYPAQPAPVGAVAAPPAPTPVADAAAAEEAEKKPLGQRSLTPAITTGVVAGVALVSFVVNGILALQNRSDFEKDLSTDTANSADTHAILADISLGAAIALGLTSAILFVRYGKDKQEPEPTPAAKLKPTFMASPIFTKDSAGAGATIRF